MKTGVVKQSFLMVGVMLLPLVGNAAEPLLLKPEDTKPTQKFFALDKARAEAAAGKNGMAINKETKSFALHSDKADMNAGGMRIDRARSIPLPPQHALILHPQPEQKVASLDPNVTAADLVPGAERIADSGDTLVQESEEMVGNREGIDPVLALFGDGDTGTPSSFRDALSGKTGSVNAARQLSWPIPPGVEQYISSLYGMRADPFNGRQTFHGGIDIAAAVGTPVLATASGQVLQVRADPNYGKYVMLQSADGTISRYGHLSAQTVTEGQMVRAGQTIGAVGATGHATGAHLDYRVSKNDIKFDPLSILSIPAGVSMAPGKSTAVATTRGKSTAPSVAQNALPKRPMVIQVR